MRKVKHDFQVPNQKISFGNACMIQNCFIFFDRNSCSSSNYQLHAAQLWTGCTEFYNLTRSQSRNEINTHTEHKNTMICFNWKEAIWSLTKKKKRGNKKEKLTKSLLLTVKIARRSNYNIDLRKLRVNKITGHRNHTAALNEEHTHSPQWFFIRSSI